VAVEQRIDVHEARDVTTDGDAQLDGLGLGHLVHPVDEIVVEDDGGRTGVLDDALDLGSGEGRIEGDGLVAPLLRRQLPHDDIDVVRQGVSEDVTCHEILGPQAVHHLVGTAGQLRERQGPDGGGGHDGRLTWKFGSDVPNTEGPVPGVLHRE
jgi:hypothetical protein